MKDKKIKTRNGYIVSHRLFSPKQHYQFTVNQQVFLDFNEAYQLAKDEYDREIAQYINNNLEISNLASLMNNPTDGILWIEYDNYDKSIWNIITVHVPIESRRKGNANGNISG